MKNNPQPARTRPYNESKNPSFQFDSKIFTLPQPSKELFNRGNLDNVRFSKTFANQNVHQAVSRRIISAAVGYFAIHYFPDTAAKIFISFNEQVSYGRLLALRVPISDIGVQSSCAYQNALSISKMT